MLDDLSRWADNGWVTPDGQRQIAAELSRRGGIGLAPALGILASVLFGFAAISFVAAHWEDVPRLGRLAMLLLLLWTGYGLSGFFAQRGHQAFADAAVLFSTAIFGAGIALISQMYHIDGNPPDGVLLWWIGALFAGVTLRSNPALALALILVVVWSWMEMSQQNRVHWPFLIGWGLVTAALIWQRWSPGLHLSALALSLFVVSLGYLLRGGQEHAIVAMVGLLAALGAVAVEKLVPEYADMGASALGYAIAVAFAGLFAIQFIENPGFSNLIALAALTLIFLLAAIGYGVYHHNRGAIWLGYIGFSIEIMALYVKTVGTILGTSLFFLIAGLIVAGLAYMALRIAKRANTAEIAA